MDSVNYRAQTVLIIRGAHDWYAGTHVQQKAETCNVQLSQLAEAKLNLI